MRLAFTLLPDGRLPRVVLVTDGLETRGSAAAALETAQRFGVPIHYEDFTDVARPQELMVTELTVPDEIRPKVPFTATVKVRTTAAMAARCELLIDGILEKGEDVELERGENTVTVEATVKAGGEKKIAATCAPKDAANDRFASNNRFEIPVKVPERPKLLYVEGERSYAKNLAAAFSDDFDVEYRGARGVPGSMADAGQFDLIFISDVPRTGDMGYENMTTTQMRVLDQYARAGGGLVFAGGENSFGPGGYTQTYLERQVLPVWLDVQRKQDIPGVALMLVIDRSGSMTGPKIELAKQAAIATLNVLQPNDKLGIIAFDSRPSELVKLQRASNRYKITDSVSKLRSGGGTNVFAALDQAYNELVPEQAKVKHIILLTDGQSNRAGILELVSRSFEDKITISTVAVGMGADQELLKRIAEEGRGRYYFTNDAQNIPQLFLKETSEVSRRALVEDRFRPRVDPRFRHLQIFRGLDMAQAPTLIGYVSTRAKPRAEVIMTSHLGEPLLARWRLGLGKVVVWTSDVKNRWSHYWLSWGGYAKFWRQLVRDTMRVETEDPSYTMVADVADGKLTVGVDAVDDEDKFIEGVTSDVKVTGPDGEEIPVPLVQTAAGRYEGTVELDKYGPYTVRGKHVPGNDPDATHQSFATVAWPFPPEHLVGDPDLTEVKRLADATGGLKDPTPAQLFDVGDAHSEHRVPMWPLPLYAALGLLVADVLLRRVRLYGKTQIAWREVRGR
ncbi:MAG: VWA domain-containing protein [Myxococcales bacterium]|nr:VWA domain-containing protein [Myxococcales bacterium]